MSDEFCFISLNKNAEEWADIILEKRKSRYKNEEACINIKKSGYDINEETKKLNKYLVIMPIICFIAVIITFHLALFWVIRLGVTQK
jgi:C4-dicarboxylate transporter